MIIDTLPGKDFSKQYINFTFFYKGGMGEIYKAYDDVNKKEVAIKLIFIADPTDEELLTREIEISSKLFGKNIVTTHHTGKSINTGLSYLYIVQDFYVSGNLRKSIKPNIPLEDSFSMMNDILMGLKIAHTKIIHRDLKPENILIDADGNLVITDFGLAKFIADKTKTKTFKGGGTIPYMAPECWLSDKNSISMDIYSAGIIFYELLIGRLPFSSKSESDWQDFHVYQQMPDISVSRPDVPIKIKQIITKMTQKRVNDRYKNVDDVISALNEAVIQANQELKEIERLASIGHTTVERIQAEKLKSQQEKDAIDKYKNFISFHITELFEKVKTLTSSINSRLETNKIEINEQPYHGDLTRRKLNITFNSKNILIDFYKHDVLDEYERERIELNKRYQMNEYRMIINKLQPSIFKEKNIVFLGKVKSNFISPQNHEKFGYNLALVKAENDLYASWYIASFSDTGFSWSSRKFFALDLNDFLKNFELCFITHTLSVDYHELKEEDLIRTVEEILQ